MHLFSSIISSSPLEQRELHSRHSPSTTQLIFYPCSYTIQSTWNQNGPYLLYAHPLQSIPNRQKQVALTFFLFAYSVRNSSHYETVRSDVHCLINSEDFMKAITVTYAPHCKEHKIYKKQDTWTKLINYNENSININTKITGKDQRKYIPISAALTLDIKAKKMTKNQTSNK